MKKGRRLAGVYSKPLSSSSANGLPIFFFRMRRDGVWFHDRGWPTDPLIPPVGDGLAALLLDRAARLFLFANVCARSATPSMSNVQHVRLGSLADMRSTRVSARGAQAAGALTGLPRELRDTMPRIYGR